ncbi:hypothetical protein [Rhodospirillum sp. A1_3_36]|uniref:hypothetical protein n=1 Tax=Rhodospirillum sp. A1_3_36 TaxID=3391666 RepID=UPI0039A59779
MDENNIFSEKKTIVIWGDTQVGKTSWLASAIYGCEKLKSFIDMERSAESLTKLIYPHWRNLTIGMNTEGTIEEKIDVSLYLKSGLCLELRDIRGRLVHELANDSIREKLLADIDGILFLVEWDSPNLDHQFTVLYSILPFVASLPSGLIFTKCEKGLRAEAKEWSAYTSWWREWPRIQSHARVVGPFGDRAWPVSAFGYCRNLAAPDFPAVILGEFGNTMPFGIDPRNVSVPLISIMRELGIQ